MHSRFRYSTPLIVFSSTSFSSDVFRSLLYFIIFFHIFSFLLHRVYFAFTFDTSMLRHLFIYSPPHFSELTFRPTPMLFFRLDPISEFIYRDLVALHLSFFLHFAFFIFSPCYVRAFAWAMRRCWVSRAMPASCRYYLRLRPAAPPAARLHVMMFFMLRLLRGWVLPFISTDVDAFLIFFFFDTICLSSRWAREIHSVTTEV